MISYIGIGSNLGDRRELINKALSELSNIGSLKILKVSHIYKNPALINTESKDDWDKTFLNLAVKIETNDTLRPEKHLEVLKSVELKLGRDSKTKWAARPIDLDILFIENRSIKTHILEIPHIGLKSRNFVTAPLRDLAPRLKIEEKINDDTILDINKTVNHPLPVWMAIANITPDSFSDGDMLNHVEKFKNALNTWTGLGVHVIDVGAESTRPGAARVTTAEEQKRLAPILDFYLKNKKDNIGLPKLSLDSRNYETLKWALKFELDFINDVSGLSDLKILDLVQDSECDYILMHSLSVPADPSHHLNKSLSTTHEIKSWLESKLEQIDKKNISLDRVVFDPGLGFGKTARQSMKILREIDSFKRYGLRTLMGHSRKSFMASFSNVKAQNRDLESAGLSIALAEKGVDFLRVHNPEIHMKTHLGFLYAH